MDWPARSPINEKNDIRRRTTNLDRKPGKLTREQRATVSLARMMGGMAFEHDLAERASHGGIAMAFQ